MFLLIPLSILIISLALIAWIVSRKFVYLKKLEPETVQTAFEANGSRGNFLAELFPGVAAYFSKSRLQTLRVNFLTEFEKLLRKLRLISLQVDDLTNRLIKSVRSSTRKHEEMLIKETKLEEKKIAEFDNEELLSGLGNSEEELKQKEQLLIIEIAKNPKNPQLYLELGNIYMKVGEYEDAKNSFARAVELNPGDEGLKRRLSRAVSKIEKNPPE